jgi:hypothetical protein
MRAVIASSPSGSALMSPWPMVVWAQFLCQVAPGEVGVEEVLWVKPGPEIPRSVQADPRRIACCEAELAAGPATCRAWRPPTGLTSAFGSPP